MRGVFRVLGGAGTGKSSLLIQAATAHIGAGSDPESVLLLTGSARVGSQARAAITSALLSAGSRGTVREPLVRTVHSYAFAVLRLAAQRTGDPPPRLITSAEQDGIIRELLAGDLEDGDASPVAWPTQLRPALSTVGFANQLRDLLARCTERGVDPIALQRIGRTYGRPEWLAAGQFGQAYEQIMLLGWRRRKPRCPLYAPPNLSVPHWKRSPPTRTCWRRSAAGSSCSSSTTRSTSTRRRLGWFACCRPARS
jgi:superfamily I DNA/RNA helicase